MYNPHQITKEFEQALCEYTGARFAVAVNSCTMALLLACRYQMVKHNFEKGFNVIIPKRTYVSVPQSIIHAGFSVSFHDINWLGFYELSPLSVFDSARYFEKGMFDIIGPDKLNKYICVSHHTTKILGDTQGGAILHNDPKADAWFRKARFDGRTEGVAPKNDDFDMIGYHCYMSPDVSARLLWNLGSLPSRNPPLPNDDYPDLSKFKIFNGGRYGS